MRSYAGAALALALGAAAVLAVVLLAEGRRPWKQYARLARERRAAIYVARARAAGTPEALIRSKAAAIGREPIRIRQIVPTLTGKPERCLTCHFGI
ncbi:MAG: hypothetical protein KJ621_13540, partial [Proteobacteria bacterium]|nr:hypothetical protein [Pseudomonadota bacterium]